ncbi:MAG: SH3 domain-containing protein [Pacificimonas sp.]
MIIRALLASLALLTVSAPNPALSQSSEAERGRSGLPIPRFVSLGANEARMRAGPGRDYPVRWLYIRKGLPMEVVDEWGIYRKVRDPDGEEGWMDKALLSGARMGLVAGKKTTILARPDADAPPVWQAEAGVIGRLQLCEGGWCRLQADGRAGFIRAADLWGVYADEVIE